ncbi:hypothetical protein EO93_01915 [Methanosarcina sp. 1.H.A.2.2]|nr:hypothetical protein EO93_01915 [Methanosarcina sp. 1.H.A.2.2]
MSLTRIHLFRPPQNNFNFLEMGSIDFKLDEQYSEIHILINLIIKYFALVVKYDRSNAKYFKFNINICRVLK